MLDGSAVGDREQTPMQIDAADRRQRAFSPFVKAYDQLRRAIQYLRWEQGDADSIARDRPQRIPRGHEHPQRSGLAVLCGEIAFARTTIPRKRSA